eukprot:Gb_07149 [translate_table: standard]
MSERREETPGSARLPVGTVLTVYPFSRRFDPKGIELRERSGRCLFRPSPQWTPGFDHLQMLQAKNLYVPKDKRATLYTLFSLPNNSLGRTVNEECPNRTRAFVQIVISAHSVPAALSDPHPMFCSQLQLVVVTLYLSDRKGHRDICIIASLLLALFSTEGCSHHGMRLGRGVEQTDEKGPVAVGGVVIKGRGLWTGRSREDSLAQDQSQDSTDRAQRKELGKQRNRWKPPDPPWRQRSSSSFTPPAMIDSVGISQYRGRSGAGEGFGEATNIAWLGSAHGDARLFLLCYTFPERSEGKDPIDWGRILLWYTGEEYDCESIVKAQRSTLTQDHKPSFSSRRTKRTKLEIEVSSSLTITTVRSKYAAPSAESVESQESQFMEKGGASHLTRLPRLSNLAIPIKRLALPGYLAVDRALLLRFTRSTALPRSGPQERKPCTRGGRGTKRIPSKLEKAEGSTAGAGSGSSYLSAYGTGSIARMGFLPSAQMTESKALPSTCYFGHAGISGGVPFLSRVRNATYIPCYTSPGRGCVSVPRRGTMEGTGLIEPKDIIAGKEPNPPFFIQGLMAENVPDPPYSYYKGGPALVVHGRFPKDFPLSHVSESK